MHIKKITKIFLITLALVFLTITLLGAVVVINFLSIAESIEKGVQLKKYPQTVLFEGHLEPEEGYTSFRAKLGLSYDHDHNIIRIYNDSFDLCGVYSRHMIVSDISSMLNIKASVDPNGEFCSTDIEHLTSQSTFNASNNNTLPIAPLSYIVLTEYDIEQNKVLGRIQFNASTSVDFIMRPLY